MTIQLHPQVNADILRGIAFYDAQSYGLGAYFQTMVISAIDSLQFFPAIHAKVRGYHRMLVDKFPYAVYYKIFDDRVVVYSVLDMRMNPDNVNAQLDSLS